MNENMMWIMWGILFILVLGLMIGADRPEDDDEN
jgi:hypothetical protein